MKDLPEDAEELIQQYLDGVIGSDDLARLARLIGDHPDIADQIADWSRFEALVEDEVKSDTLAVQALVESAAAGETAGSRRGRPSSRRSSRRQIQAALIPFWRRTALWASAAAALLIVTLAHLYNRSQVANLPDAISVAILKAQGEVQLVRRGEPLNLLAAQETPVQTGDAISVGATGRATLLYRQEETSLDLLADTRIDVRDGRMGRQVHLQQGEILARVAPQAPTQGFCIATAHAEASVLGTEFRMQASLGNTVLAVTDGAVRFLRSADGTSVIVSSRQMAAAHNALLGEISQPFFLIPDRAYVPRGQDARTVRPLGEVGVLKAAQADKDAWHTVGLHNAYANPVVILGLLSNHDAEPCTVRIRNVTSTAFEWQIDEWEYLDGTHAAEAVGYLVVEAGTHRLDGGTLLLAGTTPVRGDAPAAIPFPAGFTDAPVLLTQIVTAETSLAAVAHPDTVTPQQGSIRIWREEEQRREEGQETVAWVAVTRGADNLAGLPCETFTMEQQRATAFNLDLHRPFGQTPMLFAALRELKGRRAFTLRCAALSGKGAAILIRGEASKREATHPITAAVNGLAVEPGWILGE